MTIWEEIHSVAFIVNTKQVGDPMKLKMNLDAIFPKLGKREIIVVSEEKIKPEEMNDVRNVTYISEKDYNFFGKLKNQPFMDALDQHFDAIFVCNELSGRIAKAIAKSKTKRFIGLNSSNNFVQINIDAKSSKPIEMLNFAKEILNKITS